MLRNNRDECLSWVVKHTSIGDLLYNPASLNKGKSRSVVLTWLFFLCIGWDRRFVLLATLVRRLSLLTTAYAIYSRHELESTSNVYSRQY